MTKQQACAELFRTLAAAPMDKSRPKFERLARNGDVEGFWNYYIDCLTRLASVDVSIEREGKTSFRMLRPRMEAIYSAYQQVTPKS